MAMPFYILYADARIGITGAMLGVLTTIWMLTGTAANLVWGSIADRSGYRLVMIMTLTLWIAAHIQLLFVDGVLSVMGFFVLIGSASGGFNQSRQNMVLELGRDADIPLRVAVSNMAVSTISTVGPLVAGLIISASGYTAVFVICIFIQVVALVVLTGWIPEPRHLHRP